ncbi:MAG: LamG domain-containing protein [Chitinophagaceae bacterium]|nr:MAG: LamG domain-containing protein [Chitinophagaceae bacterium]
MKQLFLAGVAVCLSSVTFAQTAAGNALGLIGSTYISVPDNASLDLQDAYTLETWIRPTDLGADRAIMSKGSQYGLTMAFGGSLIFNSADMGPIPSGIVVPYSVWSHVAVTFNVATDQMKFYLNGNLVSTVSGLVNTASDGSNLYIGLDGNQLNPMIGYLDELHIWNKALTPAEIVASMISEIKPSSPNYSFLVGYWKFNESGGAVAADVTGNNNGNAINATWPASGVTMIDATIGACDVVMGASGGSSLSVGNAAATMTAGSAGMMFIYTLIDASISVNAPLVESSRIGAFGVKLFNSSGGTYEVVYDYSTHPGINDETKLRLASRPDGASSWSTTAATQNLGANTLTLGGQTGTEFNLATIAGGNNALPVSLLSFEATALKTGEVRLLWQTASETNNDYFSVMRSKDAISWEQALRVAGAGNSTSLRSYEATDANPHAGVSFYRLRQTDFNGRTSYSRTVKLTVKKEIFIKVDAARRRIIITGLDGSAKDFNIFSLLGQSLTRQVKLVAAANGDLVLDVSALTAQVYLFVTNSGEAKKFRL